MMLACASDNGDADADTDDAAKDAGTDDSHGAGENACDLAATAADAEGNIHVSLTDAQNMVFRSELTVAVQTLKARSDFTIDWSEVSIDMLQQEIDPLTGIDRLQMVVWKLPEADLLVKLNNDDLAMKDVVAPGVVPTNQKRTDVRYLEMESVGGAPIDEETLLGFIDPEQCSPEQYSYSVMAAVGTNPELGFKMLHLLRFDPEVDDTEVRMTDESTKLDYEVDIESSDPVALPPGASGIVVDWSGDLNSNSLGNPFIPTKIRKVTVAHYPDLAVSDLEERFLDLEIISKERYSAEILSGASVNLNSLVDEKGSSFQGIDSVGTWIIALSCDDCANPAPWFLAVMKTCADDVHP